MPAYILGIGSTFYGKRDFRTDGSYITTEWLIVVGVPLIPLRSFRVRRPRRHEKDLGKTISVKGWFTLNWRFSLTSFAGPWDLEAVYKVYEKHFPPNWKQVIYTYGFFAAVSAWVWFMSSRCPSIFPHAFDSVPGVSCLIVVSLILVLLPWTLRYFGRKRMLPLIDPRLAAGLLEPVKSIYVPCEVPANQTELWPELVHEPQEDKGDLEEAEADKDKAMQLAAAFNQSGFDKGRYGDLAGAIADFTRALQLKPDETDVYNNRGYAKRRQGDLDGAMADFNKAIELKPNELLGYYNRAAAKKDKGDFDGAIADLTKVIELKPDEASAYTNRGAAKKDKGDLDGAVADFTQAIELKPDNVIAYESRSQVKRARGDADGANADHAKATELLKVQGVTLNIP